MEQLPPTPRFRADAPRFLRALTLACELHAEQTRKGTDIPYVAHLLGVASIAIEYGADETEAIAALLHDGPEDCKGRETLELVRGLFGDRVADIVDGCTDTYERPKPEWELRKARYIAHLSVASVSVRLVSCADKLHNARAILADYRKEGDAVFERFKAKSKQHTLWNYRRLVEAYLAAEPDSALAQELDRVVSETERLVAAAGGVCVRDERAVAFAEMDTILRGCISREAGASEVRP